MKKNLHPKKLTLRSETLRLLEAENLPAAKGGIKTITSTTIVFTEGHCETYTWWRPCTR